MCISYNHTYCSISLRDCLKSDIFSGINLLISCLSPANSKVRKEVKNFKVGTDHDAVLYGYEYGGQNPKAKENVLYIGGQTGFALNPKVLYQKYDGNRYRVVSFDSRGVGYSTPSLLQDTKNVHMEQLKKDVISVAAERFGKGEPFIIHGSSTGASLAVEVAKENPELIKAMVLETPFLASDADFANGFLPGKGLDKLCEKIGRSDIFENYINSVPENIKEKGKWKDIALYMYNRINAGDKKMLRDFLKAHMVLVTDPKDIERSCKGIDKAVKIVPKEMFRHGLALIHYMANGGHLGLNGSLSDLTKSDHLKDKTFVVYGDEDAVARPEISVHRFIKDLAIPSHRVVEIKGANHASWRQISPEIKNLTNTLQMRLSV